MLSKTGRLVKKEAPGSGTLSWKLFFAGAFINAIPGIILHIVLIPILLLFRQEKISEVIMKKSNLDIMVEFFPFLANATERILMLRYVSCQNDVEFVHLQQQVKRFV